MTRASASTRDAMEASFVRTGWIANRLMLTTMRSGFCLWSLAIVLSRNSAHSQYSRFRAMLRTGMSRNGHATLVNVSSRQCRRCATACRAGNHCAAWESPTSATVTLPFGSP